MEKKVKGDKYIVWDCESSLYDSFELKSFERQLNSALSTGRSLSMPHFINRRPTPPPQQPVLKTISRSLQKILASVFRPKQNNCNNKSLFSDKSFVTVTKMYETCDNVKSGKSLFPDKSFVAVTKMPESCDNVISGVEYHRFTYNRSNLSPEVKSLVGRSECSIGISCT